MSEGPDVVKMIREIIAANPMGRTSVTAELLIMFLEEIERLRADLAVAQSLARAQAEKTVVAKNRIEELEDARFALLDQVSALSGEDDFHIITTEQIRAAWRYMEDHSDVYVKGKIEQALFRLGIVRCEGCGGSGEVAGPDPRQSASANDTTPTDIVWMKLCPDCAEWGSEGWVVKDE